MPRSTVIGDGVYRNFRKRSSRDRIDLRRPFTGGKNRADLGTKRQLPVDVPVVHELDAHRVARDDQPLAFDVPNRHTEHAVEPPEHTRAPFLVAVNDDFGVRPGLEAVTALLELRAQLLEVVDFAVEDDPHRLFPVGHRLVTAGEIDDRQATETQSEAARHQIPFVVRPAVRDGAGHRADHIRIDTITSSVVELSRDTTHGAFFQSVRR